MKKSNYNYFAKLENKDMILYNTLSRKYILINNSKEQSFNELYNKIEKNNIYFDNNEAETIREMFQKGILIKDDINELDIIEFNENKVKFSDQYFYLTLQPTLDCNFRCTYCYEEHRNERLDDIHSNRILKYLDNITKKVKNLRISWFGGEPLLEINRIIDFTQKIKEICNNNNCHYSAQITTNGYLLNDKIINSLEQLSIANIQITVDGFNEYHDKKRKLENGEGTYDVIMGNLRKLSYKNVNINLRINVDEENIDNITEVFDIIPKENRDKVSVNIANLFQNKGKLNFYNLYLAAINKGYGFYNTKNSYMICEVCTKNGMAVEPTCKVVPCSIAAEKGYYFGKIGDRGDFIIENKDLFYKLKNISALKSNKCSKCIMLPMCMGKCKFSRYLDPDVCNMNIPDGLTLEDIAKLHYFSDIKQIDLKEVEKHEPKAI